MNTTDQFVPTSFTAAGWSRWHDVLEAEEGGKLLSSKLIELARVGLGDVVLDVAGGCGEPSLTASRAVGPGGRVVYTDISGAMLAVAEERAVASGLDNVEFIECAAEQLVFEAGSFDAVLSRAGLMLLPDVEGTLKKLHTLLKPGGRLAATVWGPLPTVQMAAGMPVLFEELGVPPPSSDGPGPFALSDAGQLAALVRGAGFHDVETGTLTIIYTTETPEQFTEFARDVGPPMIADLFNAQSSEVQKRVWDRVTDAYSRFQGADGRVHAENQAIWVVGTR